MKSLWLLMPEMCKQFVLGRLPCCYRVNELFIWNLDDDTKKGYLGCYLRLVVNCYSHSILEDFASLARIVHYFNVANINISPKIQYWKILSWLYIIKLCIKKYFCYSPIPRFILN